MTLGQDIVIVTLPGKMIDRYTYIKNYVYDIDTKGMLKPNETENSVNGKYWKDFYFLNPGKYIIVEVNVCDIEDVEVKNRCVYKCLTVFTKEDYLSNKRKQFPNADIEKFKKLYRSCGLEIVEWNGHVPNYIKMFCKNIPGIREEYTQPQEVADKLSSLLEVEDGKKKKHGISFLSERYGKN